MRFKSVLKAKLHTARVTECNLHYEGSVSLDAAWLEALGVSVHEKVLIANFTTGARWETYIIEAPRGSRKVGLNGGGARYAQVGDTVTLIVFETISDDETPRPRVLVLDAKNDVAGKKGF
jgi:aspartate 1-decarboxylase